MSSCRPRDLPDINITYKDDPQALEAAIEKIRAKMMADPHYFPWVRTFGPFGSQ